jgi:hypothetical protein
MMPATSPNDWLSRFPAAEREAARAAFARNSIVTIVPATQAHVEMMVGKLRAGDAAELAALGFTDRQALEAGLLHSIEAWTAMAGDVAGAMFGITVDSVLADEGHPWLLTTCWTTVHWIVFAKCLRQMIERYKAMFPRLSNLVDARYPEALRLLTWLGFTIDPGPELVRFHWQRAN